MDNEIKNENLTGAEDMGAETSDKTESLEGACVDASDIIDKEKNPDGILKSEQKKIEETQKNECQKGKPLISEPDSNGVRYIDMSQMQPQKPKKKILGMSKGLFIFLCCIIGFVILCIAFGNKSSEDIYPNSDYIAVLSVEGTIGSGNADYFGNPVGYQHEWMLDTIDELIDDENNQAILLYVDSPGGGVFESDELYLKLKDYQDFTHRPLYVYMASMAASGGYYISANADSIIANRNCLTGSIGVTMGTFFDFSELLENYGIKAINIDSGKYKAMGSSFREMSKDELEIWQSLVDDAYNQFVGIVAEGRDFDLNTAKALADGRIYTANQALQIGLIDEVGDFDYAMYQLKTEYELWDCEVIYPSPSYDKNFLGYLTSSGNIPELNSSELAMILELAGVNRDPISYTCEALM